MPGIGGLPKPPLPKGGGLAKPNRGDSAAKATDLFTIHSSLKMPFPFPHGSVLMGSACCESLSHASGVPAPFGKGAILCPVFVAWKNPSLPEEEILFGGTGAKEPSGA